MAGLSHDKPVWCLVPITPAHIDLRKKLGRTAVRVITERDRKTPLRTHSHKRFVSVVITNSIRSNGPAHKTQVYSLFITGAHRKSAKRKLLGNAVHIACLSCSVKNTKTFVYKRRTREDCQEMRRKQISIIRNLFLFCMKCYFLC